MPSDKSQLEEHPPEDSSNADPTITNAPLVENNVESEEEKPSVANGDLSGAGDAKAPEEKPEWADILGSGAILKKILREGEPDSHPVRQQNCVINYELYLEDGTFVERKENFEMQLGEFEVVQGLDVVMGMINVGEKALVKIIPRLAYGSVGLPPLIPPETPVRYEIELVSVRPYEEPESLSILERKLQGNRKREIGNWWYGRGENTMAIQCYRRALGFLDEVEGGITDPSKETNEDNDHEDDKEGRNSEVSVATLQGLLEDRISVCNNMAAAQIKMELYEAALNSLQTVLRCQPNNVKALFRKAKIYRAKNDLQAALKCLKKAEAVSPDETAIQNEIASVNKLIQKQKTVERDLAKRMFGETTAGQSKENKEKQNKVNLLRWSAALAASVAVALVGVAAYRLRIS